MKENGEEFDFKVFARQAADALRSGKPLAGKDGVFTPMLKMIIESALEGELDDHLAQTRKGSKNRRNGHGAKNIQSSLGGFEVLAPRDRNSSFEPRIVGKRQHKISSDIDQQIIALFGRGMSYRDIQQHVGEMYGIEVSEGTITAITDRLYPQIVDWQSRPLESLYPVVWLDAMHFKVREDGVVKTKAVYSILGVTKDGQKEVLGVYFGDHESSRFWRQVLHELKLRGVKDILVICIDNLSGFAEAVEDVFPQTDVQLCLVHQMRNSMKCITEKDLKPMIRDLKKIYTSDNEKTAFHYLEEAESVWGEKYRVVFKSWHRNWDKLTNFYKYPPQLRRLIYTTNPIESYHRMVRKVTKTKGAFSSENAILKQIYLATMNAKTKWNGSIFAWPSIRKDLIAYFDERFEGNDTV